MKKVLQLLPEDVIRRALEGHTNILAPAEAELRRYFANLTCTYCKSDNIYRKPNPQQLFRDGEILPNYLACCESCGAEFEPYTKILVSMPKTRSPA